MTDNNDPLILPSPGEQGAFHCALCANGKLRIGWEPGEDHTIIVRLYCPRCGNWYDWLLRLGVPEGVKN